MEEFAHLLCSALSERSGYQAVTRLARSQLLPNKVKNST